jgi:selenium metabolism protein YedF
MSIQDGFVMFVAGDGLGRGDEDLGSLLMDRFLHEVGGASTMPERVIFMNSGVKLVADDSPVLDQLRHLEKTGIEIVACGTCLERYGLIDRVAVGEKTDMRTIAATLTQADKILSL